MIFAYSSKMKGYICHLAWNTYSVSQKNPPAVFWPFFPKRLGIFNHFLYTYITLS